MKLSNGLRYHRQKHCFRAYIHGKLIAHSDERQILIDHQARGAWLHYVALILMHKYGWHILDAMDFACGPIKNAPPCKF